MGCRDNGVAIFLPASPSGLSMPRTARASASLIRPTIATVSIGSSRLAAAAKGEEPT